MEKRKGLKLGSLVLVAFFLGNLFIVPIVLLNVLNLESNVHTSSSLQGVEGPEFLEIKMAMALPYATEWDSPKSGKGLLKKNGEFYTLIETHFENDSLYFKYIKNTNAREIFSLLSDQVDMDDAPQENDNSRNSSLLSQWLFLKLKTNKETNFDFLSVEFKEFKSPNFFYISNFESLSVTIDTPPPQLV